MPRVVHFEVHADDLERASRFYSELFGWTIRHWGGPWDYRVITTGPDGQPGINGGMVRRMGKVDGQSVIAYVCTIEVESMDATLERALALGARVAHPKMQMPGVGWLMYMKDTEGNLFGITQSDPSAD